MESPRPSRGGSGEVGEECRTSCGSGHFNSSIFFVVCTRWKKSLGPEEVRKINPVHGNAWDAMQRRTEGSSLQTPPARHTHVTLTWGTRVAQRKEAGERRDPSRRYPDSGTSSSGSRKTLRLGKRMGEEGGKKNEGKARKVKRLVDKRFPFFCDQRQPDQLLSDRQVVRHVCLGTLRCREKTRRRLPILVLIDSSSWL